ncbi:MAG: universal stress protein [Serratia liquefaciens]|nr:universal stress protein [Serratia liquefaciens]
MNNTVIACVDGSPSTRPVCEYAAWAAALLDSPLSLLHVLEKDAHPAVSDLTGSIGIDSQAHLTEELVKGEGERSRLLMAQGKAILASCAKLLNDAGHADVQLLQKHGALDEILADLGDVRLMVLGRRGTQNPVGSHLESIIRLQKKPVLIVPEAYSPPSKVMFAYDGSDESRKNLTRLTLSPLLNGLVCHLVMVKGDTPALQEAQSVLQAAGITTESHLLEGTSVAEALCRHANENDINLIVMGAYGHSPLRRFFIGSNTTAMLEKTQIPLLMLR